MKKNSNSVPSAKRSLNSSGMVTNAIPLPQTPNGMNFDRVEPEEYFRLVENDIHEGKEPALPSEPIEDVMQGQAYPSRDWMYEHKLRQQVEDGGHFMIRPMANRKALNDRYDTDD